MSPTLILNTLRAARSNVTTLSPVKRSFSQSSMRQAIMMPALSPFMTEGTITRWNKKEGDSFSAGDILLQIESDISMVEVRAENPGIIGKILMPDGTAGVRVEQVIALVANDAKELKKMQRTTQVPPPLSLGSPRPSAFPPLASASFLSPASGSLPTPFTLPFSARPVTPTRYAGFSQQRTMSQVEQSQSTMMSSSVHRSYPVPELHSEGVSSVRAMSTAIPPPSPIPATSPAASPVDNSSDALALRRKILTNLSQGRSIGTQQCDYFEGLI